MHSKLATQRLCMAVATPPERGLVAVPAEPRRAGQRAEDAGQAQNELLDDASRELRAPVDDILKRLERLLETPLTDGQRQTLEGIRSAAGSVLGKLNDLGDLSRIETGKLELERGDFFLRTAVGETLRALALQAHRKGVKLVHEVQPDVPDALIGDVGRLRQILFNLVDDQIKQTGNGEVCVQVAVEGAKADAQLCLRFSIRSTGDASGSPGGSGLGIALARRLIANMDGEFTLQGEVGRGRTCAFTARFGQRLQLGETVTVAATHLRALVVDEDGEDRKGLDRELREAKVDSTAVGDAVAAMDRLWAGVTTGKPYQLVFVDARMQKSDSQALVARIRSRHELAGTCVVLMTKGDLGRCGDLRVDALLPKPILRHRLLEAIRLALK